jgi:hypothetical protein
MDERVHVTRFLGREVVLDLEALTSPAKRHANAEASNFVMSAMPERPASRFFQPSATLLPTGLISPSPVTTTRR